MLNRQHPNASSSKIVYIQVAKYIIYISTSLCVDEFTFLQYIVKSAELMRLFAYDLTYNLVL